MRRQAVVIVLVCLVAACDWHWSTLSPRRGVHGPPYEGRSVVDDTAPDIVVILDRAAYGVRDTVRIFLLNNSEFPVEYYPHCCRQPQMLVQNYLRGEWDWVRMPNRGVNTECACDMLGDAILNPQQGIPAELPLTQIRYDGTVLDAFSSGAYRLRYLWQRCDSTSTTRCFSGAVSNEDFSPVFLVFDADAL